MRKFNLIVAIGITFNVLSSTNPLLAAESEPENVNSGLEMRVYKGLEGILDSF